MSNGLHKFIQGQSYENKGYLDILIVMFKNYMSPWKNMIWNIISVLDCYGFISNKE